MEGIQAYGNETDSDSENDHGIVSPKQNLWVKNIEESKFTLNFFGLESASHESRSTSIAKSIPNKINQEQNEDSSSSVPDGDFWKGFTPDPSNANIDDLNVHSGYENVIERTCKNVPRLNLNKRSVENEHGTFQNTTGGKRVCSSGNHVTQERSFKQQPQTEQRQQQEEKRKIFYVHSKVTPYLTSSHTCYKCVSKLKSTWRAHDQAVNRLQWNKSNFSHLLLTAGMDSTIKVWNVWSCLDSCVAIISHHSKAVRNALWGIQGRSIISCSYDKTAIVTDVESGSIQSRHIHPDFVLASCLHPNNPNCFVTGCENLIQFWDIRTPLAPTKVLTHKNDMGQPQDLLFIQNGNELISCNDIVSRDSSDRTIMAWDIKSGNVISNQIYQEKYTCTRLKRCPTDSEFLAQTQGGYVALFSTTRPYKIDKNKRFEGHKMQGYNIGFDVSPDGSLVYSGSADGGIHCYDYRSGRLIKKCTNNSNDVITDVACHPVLSSLLASCTWGGSLALWH